MKKELFIVLAFVFSSAACGSQKTTQVVPSSISTDESPNVNTTSAQISSIATITPLPATPVLTPTFNIKTIVTVTPAPKADCPKENPSLKPNFGNCGNDGCSIPDSKTILNYLNSGGKLDEIKYMGKIEDFTGDDVKELLAYSTGKFSVYGCNDGKYQALWEFKGTQRTPHLDYVGDLNRDGIPELIVINAERHAFLSIHIFAWNGKNFISLIKRNVGNDVFDFVGGTVFEYKISDVNNDGIKEIIGIDDDLFTYEGIPGIPSRRFTTIVAWNGNNYVIASSEPSPPVYRFQAVQDADYEVQHGQYEKALSLYREAIFNDKLEWWSKERHEYEVYTKLGSYFDQDYRSHPIGLTMTPTSYPTMPVVTPDVTEYPRLAAYAYFRIMLVQVMRGNLVGAKTNYETLQHKFSANQYGSPYVEMATAFWSTYQSSQNITFACGSAIEYAGEHPSILIPLGSDYHGSQAKRYKPEDVCPFQNQ